MSQRTRILLVDDDPSMRAILTFQLTQEGWDVEAAESPQQALILFELRCHDLIVTDLAMPGMSGLELLSEVKRRSPAVVVIILTGSCCATPELQARRAGAFAFLRKPCAGDSLRAVVRSGVRSVSPAVNPADRSP